MSEQKEAKSAVDVLHDFQENTFKNTKVKVYFKGECYPIVDVKSIDNIIYVYLDEEKKEIC